MFKPKSTGEVWVEDDLTSLDWCCDYRLDRCFDVGCTQIHLQEYSLDFMNNHKCTRGVECNYLQVTKTEKALYLRHNPDIMKIILPEAIRSRQISGICKYFKYGECADGNACKKLHLTARDTPMIECSICCNPIERVLVFEKCRHCVCEQCLPKMFGFASRPQIPYYDINNQPSASVFMCPYCKQESKKCLELRGKGC